MEEIEEHVSAERLRRVIHGSEAMTAKMREHVDHCPSCGPLAEEVASGLFGELIHEPMQLTQKSLDHALPHGRRPRKQGGGGRHGRAVVLAFLLGALNSSVAY